MFGAAAPAHVLSRNFWLAARAERLGNQFFDYLRDGQSQRAFELTARATQPNRPRPHGPEEAGPEGKAAEPSHSKTNPRGELDTFLVEQPVATLLAMGKRMVVRRVHTDILPSELLRQEIAIRYEIRADGSPGAKPLAVLLYVRQMAVDPGEAERWVIVTVTSAPLAAN